MSKRSKQGRDDLPAWNAQRLPARRLVILGRVKRYCQTDRWLGLGAGVQRSAAHPRAARASPPALRRGGAMSQGRRGERRSSKQAKVHSECPARRGGPGGMACGGMEQLQETSWSVAV
ncbi:MAG: hypothetical protein DMG29_19030, partial [Acidobacteria bacterium]